MPVGHFGVILGPAEPPEGMVMAHDTINITPVTPNIGGVVDGIAGLAEAGRHEVGDAVEGDARGELCVPAHR